MKLSSAWLYEQLVKKYKITEAAGLSGRDSYLRPFFGNPMYGGERTGHVCVIPVASEQEIRELQKKGLSDRTFFVFVLCADVTDCGGTDRVGMDCDMTDRGGMDRGEIDRDMADRSGTNRGFDTFCVTWEKNMPDSACVCVTMAGSDGSSEKNRNSKKNRNNEENRNGRMNGAAEILNYLQEIFDTCDAWEERVIGLLAGNAGIAKVLEISVEFLANPLMVMDADFSLIAEAEMEKLPERARLFTEEGLNVEYMNALLQDAEYQKITQAKGTAIFPGYISGYRSVIRNLFIDAQPTYRLVLTECDTPVSESCFCILETLAGHLEYQLSREMPASMKGTLETIFQSILTDRTADYVQVSRRLSAVGWNSGDEYLCLILQITYLNQKQLSTGAICHYIQRQFRDSVSFLYQEEVVSFFNLTRLGMNEEEVASKLVYFIRDSYLKAGYSRTTRGHMNLRRQYIQARTALDVGSRKKPYLWIHYFNQVALTYIIEQSTRRLPANMICHEGLLRLKEQDEKNHTEYMATLKTYLDQGQNATQAAKELFIHRSTFLYRMEKIKEILRSDLDDAEELFYLELSFRLLEQDEEKKQ